MFGFLCVNKPRGITSHDVINKLRKQTGFKKIGHTGTLDPFATGVLVVCFGGATRLIEYLKEDKAYVAELKFGEISDTYDTEGNIEKFSDKKVTSEQVCAILHDFKGKIIQTPPKYSAISVNGKKLYEYARSGVEVEIPKRQVEIFKLKLLKFDYEKQTAQIEIECSKGTYIRSLGFDIGIKLGCGAYLTALERTKSGPFIIQNAVSTEDVSSDTALANPTDVLRDYKKHELNDEDYKRIKHGNPLCSKGYNDNEILFLLYKNKVVACAQVKDKQIKIKKVLAV